jgi:hypothetical protein
MVNLSNEKVSSVYLICKNIICTILAFSITLTYTTCTMSIVIGEIPHFYLVNLTAKKIVREEFQKRVQKRYFYSILKHYVRAVNQVHVCES